MLLVLILAMFLLVLITELPKWKIFLIILCAYALSYYLGLQEYNMVTWTDNDILIGVVAFILVIAYNIVDRFELWQLKDMIIFKDGDIFKDTSEAIVNAVNCVGVMGKGIALKFKENYPNNYTIYKTACDHKEVKIGKMFVYKESNKLIINFPTKEHWRNDSKLEYIEEGLKDLVKVLQSLNIESIAMPAIGCGSGGLNWNRVKKTIEKYLTDVDMNIVVYSPVGINKSKGEMKMSVNYLVVVKGVEYAQCKQRQKESYS